MRDPDRQTSLGDYAQVLKAPTKDGQPRILVGGQAVNAWAAYYLQKEPELRQFLPFLSKDLDLLGTVSDLSQIKSATGFKVFKSPQKIPTDSLGYLWMPHPKAGEVKIEILRSIHGVGPNDVQNSAATLPLDGLTVRVPDPVVLLRAKTANAVDIEQNKPGNPRQDVKHMRMMILCNRVFFREAVEKVQKGELTARECLTRLEEILSFTREHIAQRAVAKYKVQWSQALPLCEIQRSSDAKIQRFWTQRLPRVFPEIG